MVKGTIIRAHVDWVRESASREQAIEFFESLPPDVRRDATSALPSASYPSATLAEIDRAIVWTFGQAEALRMHDRISGACAPSYRGGD